MTGRGAGGLKANPSTVGGGWQELSSWEGDAAVDPRMAQHIPEEEKEEEEEEAGLQQCLTRVPRECCCLDERDLDADSGMSHSQEWTLPLPGEGFVLWEVPGSPCHPAKHSSSSSMLTLA